MKKRNIEEEKLNIYQLEDLYRPSDDIFNDDSNLYSRLKKILFYKLDDTERRIILCYAHTGNLRDTAKLFKLSTSTIFGYIRNIKTKIKDNL